MEKNSEVRQPEAGPAEGRAMGDVFDPMVGGDLTKKSKKKIWVRSVMLIWLWIVITQAATVVNLNWEIVKLNRKVSQSVKFSEPAEPAMKTETAADLGLIFVSTGGYSVYAMEPDGKNRRELTEMTAAGAGTAWPEISPDGKKIVYIRDDGEIQVKDVVNGQVLFATRMPKYCGGYYQLTGFGWDKDSLRVAYTLNIYGLDVVDPECEPGEEDEAERGVYQINTKTGKMTHLPINVSYDTPVYTDSGREIYLDTWRYFINADDGKRTAGLNLDKAVPMCGDNVYAGICGRNVCVAARDRKAVPLTNFIAHPEISDQSGEGAREVEVTGDCRHIVYTVGRSWMPPITPGPDSKTVFFTRPLYVMDRDGKNNRMVDDNIRNYWLTPDGMGVVWWEKTDKADVKTSRVRYSDWDGGGTREMTINEMEKELLAVVSPDGKWKAYAIGDSVYVANIDGNNEVKIAEFAVAPDVIDWK